MASQQPHAGKLAMKKKQTKKVKIKIRNWEAVNAHFRNSAGSMKDKKKDKTKKSCRTFKYSKDKEEE